MCAAVRPHVPAGAALLEQGQVGGNDTTARGRRAGAAQSVRGQTSSAISKVTDGLKGGGAKTDESSTADTSK